MDNSDMIICRCEEVSYKQLISTAKLYSCSPRELKLRTRAGMGYCGGRVCRSMIEIIALAESKNISRNNHLLKFQPPIRPISFDNLGGKI